MEIYKLNELTFKYPGGKEALKNITTEIKKGEFVTVCGKSGCGKTTLLRLLKPSIAPFGELFGEICFEGRDIKSFDDKTLTESIGFVMQNPDNQIVTDKVWHELSFGLENMGVKTPQIRAKVSEMASFFGIEDWFYKKTTDLSGGQKQILNLASVMVMMPKVLILDEPTSRLDPISASEFLQILKKINTELGVTVIIAEQRLEEVFAISDKVVVIDSGSIIAEGTPREVGRILKYSKWDMKEALPTAVQVFESRESEGICPLTISEARQWLSSIEAEIKQPKPYKSPKKDEMPIIRAEEVFFRYDKNGRDIIKNLNLTVYDGEILAIVGGNGAGKSTALSLISGINKPQRGEIYIKGKKISQIPDIYNGILGVLPQEPKSLFSKKTVLEDLLDMTDKDLPREQREDEVNKMARLCRICEVMASHPYDLSGGEQQRAALAMVLLKKPQILILDEPTKGVDAHFKRIFAGILKDLKNGGATVIMVSHDLDFCAEFADRCALFYDGAVTSEGDAREFFSNNYFYTTSARRMARGIIENAVLTKDIIGAVGGAEEKVEDSENYDYNISKRDLEELREKPSPEIAKGIFFSVCFILSYVVKLTEFIDFYAKNYLLGGAAIVFLGLSIKSFFPQKELGTENITVSEKKLKKRTQIASFAILLLIPLTIFFGIYYLGDRKYYFISLLIILETILPFILSFESRKAEARKTVIISVLCAIGVAGRTAFFMIPEFKPLLAVIIISGACMGAETGFLVGAMTGFVSNFFFGQGPWTPWQMFALGIIGFISGILFNTGILKKTRYSLAVFGFFAALLIYGGIMNPASVLMVTQNPTREMIYSAYLVGFPIDFIHAMSTGFFLWLLSAPMIDKINRIQQKYGI